MNCTLTGCQEQATHAVKLMVPATGYKIDEHQPLNALINLHLCKKHAQEFDAPKFFGENPNFRQVFEIMARGRAKPGFKRSFVQPVLLVGEEYRQYERMKQRSE